MKSNIRLYSWYYAASSFLAWMPVFFMYFSQKLTLNEVLELEAIYYIAVVLLEIPSGYFSDKIGRKHTLLLGGCFLCLALFFYIYSLNFWILSIGQICFAAHIAFVSGTNTVFHYESLKKLGREAEYGPREAQIQKWALISGGIGALAGGLVSNLDIVFAYWLSLIAAILALAIAFCFDEPQSNEKKKAPSNMLLQIKICLSYLKNKSLMWLFTLYVFMYVMVHVPYEFYQTYLQLLETQNLLTSISAPTMSGILYALAMFIGAFAASKSIKWKNHIGLKNYLILMFLLILFIIGTMSWLLHPIIIVVIMFRSFGWSSVKAPIYEIITPKLLLHKEQHFILY